MAIKKSDLYSSLWASCDQLRGGMNAGQYKGCDAELAALEARRTKTRTLKRATMQAQITGRIRLA